MLTTDQQRTLDAAVNFTCNKIGGTNDSPNLYQEAVDELDDECGEMDDLQFDEFSLKMFLYENLRQMESAKSDIERLKHLYAGSVPACDHDEAIRVLTVEMQGVQEDLQFDRLSLGVFVERNSLLQAHVLLMIGRLTSLLALPQFRTLPFVNHLWS